MPFCTQCGSQADANARFCPSCGAPQSAASSPSAPNAPGGDLFASLTPRTASILCYVPVLGWIACVIVLAANKFHDERVARFHAFQGLYLFVAYLLVTRAIGPMMRSIPAGNLEGVLTVALLGAWIFMMVKTANNETFRLPVFGELAERSLAEQK